MSDLPESGRSPRARLLPSRRAGVTVVIVLVAVLLVMAAWVAIRALQTKSDLENWVTSAGRLRSQVAARDLTAARATADVLTESGASAATLDRDPVWRAAEFVPFIGDDLRAIRQVADVVGDLSSRAVTPATRLLATVSPTSIELRDGRIDVAALERASPDAARLATALKRSRDDADAIQLSGALPPIRSAVSRLRSALGRASEQASAADTALELAPAVLGADGPRRYLVLVENNAELRAGGGIVGAVALVTADRGRISLVQEESGVSFGHRAEPVLPLSDDTRGLYGSIVGEYMQDVTLTPRFSTSARLARAMWTERFGGRVDGVVAIDPVTLGYVLKSTGPIRLESGDTITASNAVQLLLSDLYARYPDPRAQDAFFASAAASVFAGVTGGGADPVDLLQAVGRGAAEGRVALWSAQPSEQRVLAATSLRGLEPSRDDRLPTAGVYLNDATGGKMGVYLAERVSTGSRVCRADGRPSWVVDVQLTNTAPADAAERLPPYVTGAGAFGVDPGDIRTRILVYAPSAAAFLGATLDGEPVEPQVARDGSYQVVQRETNLGPGQSTVLRVAWVGATESGAAPLAAKGTPGIRSFTTRRLALTCAGPLP
ncbi:MAG: DUF4012 domain-containing protein [Micrococcales bacterium]|nr:DUF4012 domain-containing protein [Micrococcales bacterium]